MLQTKKDLRIARRQSDSPTRPSRDRSSRLYKIALTAFAIASLVLVSFAQRQLNVSREKMGLTRLAPLENAPPVLAFTTVALGGFRGLIANALWIRAIELQERALRTGEPTESQQKAMRERLSLYKNSQPFLDKFPKPE